MRRGFTLPELMLVLAVLGIVLGMAIPQLPRALDRIEVEAASSRLIAAHRRARITAIARSQVVILSIDSAAYTISQRGTPTPLWSEIGPSADGVTLTGAPRQFTFSPVGLAVGLSNATLQFARGASSRTVIVSRLGRARVVR